MAPGAVLLLWKAFPSVTPKGPRRLQHTDWLGLLLLAGWTVWLQIILSRGTIDDWFGSPHIRYLAWVAAVTFCGFVAWQLNPRNFFPLLDIKLLGNRNILAAALIGICTGMILSGSLFVLPRFLRSIDSQTHSATQTGGLVSHPPVAENKQPGRRSITQYWVGFGIAILIIGAALYFFVPGFYKEEADDAYVEGHTVSVIRDDTGEIDAKSTVLNPGLTESNSLASPNFRRTPDNAADRNWGINE
jgi:hypothetical protein